jgi:hypothetical protein
MNRRTSKSMNQNPQYSLRSASSSLRRTTRSGKEYSIEEVPVRKKVVSKSKVYLNKTQQPAASSEGNKEEKRLADQDGSKSHLNLEGFVEGSGKPEDESSQFTEDHPEDPIKGSESDNKVKIDSPQLTEGLQTQRSCEGTESALEVIESAEMLVVSSPKQLTTQIEGITVTISDARFVQETLLSLKINDVTFSYKRSKVYQKTSYFQCAHRYRAQNSSKKCLAKAHYYSETNSIKVIDLHNPNCQRVSHSVVEVNQDYFTQKEEILELIAEKTNVTTTQVMDKLREKNNAATPNSKRYPLKHAQVKKILKENNRTHPEGCYDELKLSKTTDGAPFQRCHNKYNIIYKSKNILFV